MALVKLNTECHCQDSASGGVLRKLEQKFLSHFE